MHTQDWEHQPKISEAAVKYQFDVLLGKLLTIVDMSILNKQQHAAVKGQVIKGLTETYASLRSIAMPENLGESGPPALVARSR
jgi:hypothetical protein